MTVADLIIALQRFDDADKLQIVLSDQDDAEYIVRNVFIDMGKFYVEIQKVE